MKTIHVLDQTLEPKTIKIKRNTMQTKCKKEI